ncbi:DEHA2G21384p [Debaryomyces hansenii CBS767]|uniref:DEHA2G21384p n=1 Tax=Debaryomyces hansenii (strain ATCC 36239 / CBS 767 / BCRC 21394 / JCM 1990 / NBRC 0083 / IGC 2968) TaxID=284592 RepID=Q6BH49_DEBHA|nr:DEHA2G21384p [Debaryomyces hansenii CBS767]CAG90982.2 DEHA2G21384p [Debaryomyces hansenii CBS767]|eukprot:XP_462472.2 DEHA2G21384p [Debaryomyces hansenii CBS767]
MSSQTDASLIEHDKENIQPLPEGRSASKLALNFKNASKSVLKYKEQQQKRKEQFELQLENSEELDDPLQVFLDYINWTHDTFPQGSNTESGLLALLERCTSCFRDVAHYKNDPRYLKVWLEYTNYSDSPKDIFVYLAKKEIGTELALYYEEFAKYLELNEKFQDATQIYEMGVEYKARPLVRLERSFMQFNERMHDPARRTDRGESSIKNVLAVKRGDSAVPIGMTDAQATRKRPKLQVFVEDEDKNQDILNTLFDGSANPPELGPIKTRVKENILTSKPWCGETIKQKLEPTKPESKITVFKDVAHDTDGAVPIQTIEEDENGLMHTLIRHPGKNQEKVSLNMDLLYPEQGDEYCLDEILALTRKLSKVSLGYEEQQNLIPEEKTPLKPHNNIVDESTFSKDITFTIPLKDGGLHEDDDTHLPFKHRPNSPTMTMFSRMATNEVLTMFNDAGQNLNTDDEEEKTEGENTTNFDGFVTETIHAIKPEEKELKQQISNETGHSNEGNLEKTITPTRDTNVQGDSVQSSPFIERPSSSVIDKESNIFDPVDESLRERLLDDLATPISSYSGFCNYCYTKINKIKRFHEITNNKTKIITKGSKNSIIDYCGDEIYCLRYELGHGGYGVVYLVETEMGKLKALKVESPSSKWEYYILTQIHQRLTIFDCDIREMIVKPEALFFFQDESYLLMNYVNQGTILDVVNIYKNRGSTVDEVLCIYLTVELLKIIEVLHSIGIIHGDLKSDNCMIRFSHSKEWSDTYSRYGSDGWFNKSITLIDFGRAIDMTLFNQNAQFVSNWETDQQDCPQMNKHEPWSFEADYYGLASIIYTMLFGKYIEIKESTTGSVFLSHTLKRYWQLDLWNPLFNLLLNPYSRSDDSNIKLPITEELKFQRHRLENWLDANGSKKNLKSSIHDIEEELNNDNKKLFNSLR